MASAEACLFANGMFQTTAILNKRLNIRIMGIWRQRVPEEHEEINLPFGDSRADLLFAANAALELPH